MSDEWCPTRGGTYTAFGPEWKDGEEWKPVHTTRAPGGVPQPLYCGGINLEIGLYGKAQAMALAWSFAAAAAAEGRNIEVRAVPYKVVYDLKAQRIDELAEGKNEVQK